MRRPDCAGECRGGVRWATFALKVDGTAGVVIETTRYVRIGTNGFSSESRDDSSGELVTETATGNQWSATAKL
jgi:hypothetical protein